MRNEWAVFILFCLPRFSDCTSRSVLLLVTENSYVLRSYFTEHNKHNLVYLQCSKHLAIHQWWQLAEKGSRFEPCVFMTLFLLTKTSFSLLADIAIGMFGYGYSTIIGSHKYVVHRLVLCRINFRLLAEFTSNPSKG